MGYQHACNTGGLGFDPIMKSFFIYADKFFKPGARHLAPRAWFLEIALVHALVCVCMCPCVCVSAPRTLITNGVIWSDIGRVQLVKQVSQLFLAFNYFI